MRVALFALTFLAASVAHATDEDECQRSYVAGQRLYKLEHDLLSGRAELLVCAKTCPDELRASCGRWLEEISHEIPSIVVRVLDARGHDVPSARVELDGHAIEHYAEGLPIDLNAGPHTIVVLRERHEPKTESIVVNAGAKLRVVDVWTEPRETPTFVVRRPVPIATWTLLGVAGAALVSFGIFAAWTSAEFGQTSGCSPTCPGSSKDAAFDAKAAVADISLGVAALALVGAGVFYFARPTIRTERRISASPWLSPRGGGVALGASF